MLISLRYQHPDSVHTAHHLRVSQWHPLLARPSPHQPDMAWLNPADSFLVSSSHRAQSTSRDITWVLPNSRVWIPNTSRQLVILLAAGWGLVGMRRRPRISPHHPPIRWELIRDSRGCISPAPISQGSIRPVNILLRRLINYLDSLLISPIRHQVDCTHRPHQYTGRDISHPNQQMGEVNEWIWWFLFKLYFNLSFSKLVYY